MTTPYRSLGAPIIRLAIHIPCVCPLNGHAIQTTWETSMAATVLAARGTLTVRTPRRKFTGAIPVSHVSSVASARVCPRHGFAILLSTGMVQNATLAVAARRIPTAPTTPFRLLIVLPARTATIISYVCLLNGPVYQASSETGMAATVNAARGILTVRTPRYIYMGAAPVKYAFSPAFVSDFYSLTWRQ